MERAEFISKFGLGLAAVCAGCAFASCGGSKGSDPGPGNVGGATPPPVTGSGNVSTIDLGSQLTNVGDSIVQNGVIIVRLSPNNAAASFTAVQVSCTHEGTAIGYNRGQGLFICPANGSEFSKSGQVVMGPATSALHVYTVSVDNNMLTVTA